MLPQPLKPGDIIAITCPARKITAEELAPAIAVLEGWGYRVKLGQTVGGALHQLSGTDAERAADLQQLLADAEVKAILCARGGYGTVRVVDLVDWAAFRQNPKWVIGYSDVTVLHAHLRQWHIPTIHASMPINFATNTVDALASLRDVLEGKPLTYQAEPHPLNRTGQAEGILVGGNLSVLYSISGSASDVDTRGKILFLEDLDEYLYHIDRMMVQLDRAGKLSGLAGLVVGGMNDMKDNTIPFGMDAYQIISERVAKYGYPVCFGFPVGHIADNRALMMGGHYLLAVGTHTTELRLK